MPDLLKLTVDGLFTQDLEYACPNKASGADALAKRKEWTGDNARGEIYSGYRRQILAREGLPESLALAKELRTEFDAMVVLGIGGSALGARTAINALSLAANRKIFIVDNLDPLEFEKTWAQLDLKKTCFALITKSGGTIETMAQASEVFARLTAAGLDLKKHIVAVTDPKSGALRKWAARVKLKTLSVPPDVGGRYSVFTPVGILPIAFAGIDASALFDGAIMQFENKLIPESEVGRMGARLAELEAAGFSGKVMMPYSTLLKEFGAWFVQLWGESLGKERKDGRARGALPVAAVGATDQHSLLQMLVEGPNRMVNGFLTVSGFETMSPPKMQPLPEEFSSLLFSKGKSFGQILNAEAKATMAVLRERGRPVYEIQMAALNPQSLGALFAFYMDLVVCVAAASEVNPFDQPGVELGKRILPDLLK